MPSHHRTKHTAYPPVEDPTFLSLPLHPPPSNLLRNPDPHQRHRNLRLPSRRSLLSNPLPPIPTSLRLPHQAPRIQQDATPLGRPIIPRSSTPQRALLDDMFELDFLRSKVRGEGASAPDQAWVSEARRQSVASAERREGAVCRSSMAERRVVRWDGLRMRGESKQVDVRVGEIWKGAGRGNV